MRVYRGAVEAALEHRKSRILIDAMAVTGEVTVTQRYAGSVFLTTQIKERAIGAIRKVAICGYEPLVDPNRFGELVAVNRGVNLKVMTHRGEAVAWLTS